MLPFTDDQREALRERVQRFAEGLPRRGKPEGDPRALVKAMGDAGLLRLCVPAAFGGDAAQVLPLSLAVAREEIAYASGLADALLAVQGLSAYPIVVGGSDQTRARFLPQVATGEAIGGFAATEAEAGSDLAAVATHILS